MGQLKKLAETAEQLQKGVSPGDLDPRMAKFLAPKFFQSKAMKGECKNNSCTNERRHGSAYCQECSERTRNEKAEETLVVSK